MSKDKKKQGDGTPGKPQTKGDALVAEAENKLKSFSFFNSSSKYEDAVEIYDKAAAQYKIQKEWDQAAECYVRAAELSEKLKNIHEACNHYVNAAKAFKNTNLKESIKMYNIAVSLHLDSNRMSTAAKLWKEIAQLEEKQEHTKEAIKAWAECANCYEADDASASANQAHIKVADLSVEEEDYKRAIVIYEKVAGAAMDTQLGRWSVKDYYFKAALCHFVVGSTSGDTKTLETALEKYKEQFPAFDGTRELKLVENCLAAYKDVDSDKFTAYVRDYDRISKLDNWTAKILLDIKTALKDGPDETGEPDLT